MDAQTTVTVRCIACGKLGEVRPSCGCGATFEYISPGELAAKAVEENPNLSDREIANKLGVGKDTVRRARTTGANAPVEPRTGKDGKTRQMPRKRGRPPKPPGVKQAQRSIDLLPEVWEQVKARATAGNMTVAEFIGQLLTVTVDPTIDPTTLSRTGQDKLAAAIRQHRKILEREFEQRVAAEYTARVKRYFPELEKMEREARDTQRTYERLRRETKTPMTMAEYTLVCSCLHPDSRGSVSEERLMRAFQMFEPKVFALTGERKKNA